MRKAFLITVYHQPSHLRRLVEALQHESVSFYIHVDAKVSAGPFVEAVGDRRDVQFVKSRKVNWMGFSQVRAILELMKRAVADDADYLSLVSGSDYPIKPTSVIIENFEQAREEFMVFWRLEDRPAWLDKIRYYYPIDLVPIKDYETAGFRRYFWGYFYKLRWYMPRRRMPRISPYGGSDWWSMSGQCAKYVLDFVQKHPRYVRFYKYTQCPSEMFFQTIVLNSEFASRVRNYDRYQKWRKNGTAEMQAMIPEDSFNLRHIDWSGETTGLRECPAVLDERDFGALERSECLFARKFEERRSDNLLQMIDDRLRYDAKRSALLQSEALR